MPIDLPRDYIYGSDQGERFNEAYHEFMKYVERYAIEPDPYPIDTYYSSVIDKGAKFEEQAREIYNKQNQQDKQNKQMIIDIDEKDITVTI